MAEATAPTVLFRCIITDAVHGVLPVYYHRRPPFTDAKNYRPTLRPV